MFIRFVTAEHLPNMKGRVGIFQKAYAILRTPNAHELHATIRDQINWFEENLDTPDKFNRTKSKGAYRRNTKGLSWFRDDGNEAVTRAKELSITLVEYGIAVDKIRTDSIGHIIYEDLYQIIAEPFKDTPV